MKKLIALITLVTLSVAAFGQIEDVLKNPGKVKQIIGDVVSAGQAKHERDDLRGRAAKYNDEQPTAPLHGATIEVRMPHDYSSWDDAHKRWFRDEVKHLLTQTKVGATPVWGAQEILGEAADLDALDKNQWVDHGTMPAKGSIPVGKLIAEVDYLYLEKRAQFEAWWGRWFRGFDFGLSRETTYLGLIINVETRTGKTLASYKTLGIASSADNVSGDVVSQVFQAGYRSSGDSSQERGWRALQGALDDMNSVLCHKAR